MVSEYLKSSCCKIFLSVLPGEKIWYCFTGEKYGTDIQDETKEWIVLVSHAKSFKTSVV